MMNVADEIIIDIQKQRIGTENSIRGQFTYQCRSCEINCIMRLIGGERVSEEEEEKEETMA